MTIQYAVKDSNSVVYRCNQLLLLLFLTGIALGALFVRHFDHFAGVFSGITSAEELSLFLDRRFYQVFLSEAKFLLLVFLLGFQKWGSIFILPIFCIEGLFLGGTVCGVISLMGRYSVVMSLLILMFRLLLILPFGFLLGDWAVRRSLAFPQSIDLRNSAGVLVCTLLVMILAAFLECTLGQWLSSLYYLSIGV